MNEQTQTPSTTPTGAASVLTVELEVNIAKAIDAWLKDPWKYAEEHRRGISDVAWAQMQPHEQNFFIGDVVEFKVGGFGVIDGVGGGENGWPPSYSTKEIEGFQDRNDSKRAWHYEGDFKELISPSGLRSLMTSNVD